MSETAVDLFGHTVFDRLPGGKMCQRFIEPPFSVLDARSGRWQDRKRDWLALGIKSEIGRTSSGNNTWEDLHTNPRQAETTKQIAAVGGQSVFDPVLCELVYSWFLPKKQVHGILDPFAGGSVRGIVAARLGHQYTGVELRREQIEANIKQALEIPCLPKPHWINGDARHMEALVGKQYDLLFTCPPYWNLERYSDDPRDLSTLNDWKQFSAHYCEILMSAAERINNHSFAVIAVGNVRDKCGALRDMRGVTAAAMDMAGFVFYNDLVLVTATGSLPLRVNIPFSRNRKVGNSHQYVQCFFKGDISRIREEFPLFEDGKEALDFQSSGHPDPWSNL